MRSKILGDFQTPIALADQILATLKIRNHDELRVLEPTCGKGNFIRALVESDLPVKEVIGIELQQAYVGSAQSVHSEQFETRIIQADIFSIDFATDVQWKTDAPLLVLGNPPWVTNAAQGASGGNNLPQKSNFKGLNGIEAITGASNFDIAEYIWLKLITELQYTQATLALLCKTSVARNVLRYAYDKRWPISGVTMHRIDAKKWFDASVDACLFTVELNNGSPSYQADVFASLDASFPQARIGFVGSAFVADAASYLDLAFVDGQCPIEWRQGIKHDAAAVMELTWNNGRWQNGLGETVSVENAFIYPLLKASDLQPFGETKKRAVIVPQQHVGDDTYHLEITAPKLWTYFNQHADVFTARKSSIYRDKPPFSIFGVGTYSFAPYKLMVSGLHKQVYFVPIMPRDGKPVMADDTCYLLPFETPLQLAVANAVFNHPITARFIESVTFWDAKRPITKSLLKRIDTTALLRHIPISDIHQAIAEITPYTILSDSSEAIVHLLLHHDHHYERLLI